VSTATAGCGTRMEFAKPDGPSFGPSVEAGDRPSRLPLSEPKTTSSTAADANTAGGPRRWAEKSDATGSIPAQGRHFTARHHEV